MSFYSVVGGDLSGCGPAFSEEHDRTTKDAFELFQFIIQGIRKEEDG